MTSTNNVYRIAVASTDGKAIDAHFGEAESFFVYDVQGGGYAFIERRDVTPFSGSYGRSGGGDDAPPCLAAIGDCVAAVAVRFGPRAKKELSVSGISAFEHTGDIDGAMIKLSAYYGRNNKQERRKG